MSQLVFGKDVELRPHTIDRYGRTVAMVFVGVIDVGLELVEQGLAWCFLRYLPEASAEVQQSYQQAEIEAREQRRGLWQQENPAPIPPWEYRHKAKELTAGQ
jgi:micrococcal nuclease